MVEDPVKESLLRLYRVFAAGVVTVLINSQVAILDWVALVLPDKIEMLALPIVMALLLGVFKYLRTKFPEVVAAQVL
ncbi:MAG: hypothetical protein ACRENT_05935 [Thermodesulfobacteriota bacterium]